MKTTILKLIMILFVSKLSAQITLTSSINPVAGDIDNSATCDTNNISQGNSGANQTWSFLSLIRQDSSVINFVPAGSTPYSGQFPTSNIAFTTDNVNYGYTTTSSGNYIINGQASPDLMINYTDPELFMQYPFTYNISVTDNFESNFTSGGFTTFRTGTTTITGDAWGTIILPSGSYANALRVKYIITTKDSLTLGTVLTSVLTSYNWFVTGKKFPVFEIIYTSYSVNGIPITNSKVVNYNLGTVIGVTNISNETPDKYKLSQNYPNPFNPSTILAFEIRRSGFVSLKVHDMLGKEVADLVNSDLSPGTYKYDFNASDLSSGIYFYTLKVNEFIETKKMIFNK